MLDLEGMVVLSGYMHADYSQAFEGWHSLERETIASSAAANRSNYRRTEVLWFNPRAWERVQAGDLHREDAGSRALRSA